MQNIWHPCSSDLLLPHMRVSGLSCDIGPPYIVVSLGLLDNISSVIPLISRAAVGINQMAVKGPRPFHQHTPFPRSLSDMPTPLGASLSD